jgi:sugar lactone lactonase YvrE
MQSSKRLIIATFVVTACSFTASAQNSQDVRPLIRNARAAYTEKNYPVLIENMKKALVLRPNYGRYMYSIAVGYALSGNSEQAIQWLNRIANMGLVYDVAADNDFKSLRETDPFKAVLAKFSNNSKPIGHSERAFTFADKGFVPEGIAYDPVEKVFYLGSVYKRRIVSVNAAGEVKEFSAPQDGLWSVMGMRVDAKQRLLWVCTAAHAQMMNFDPAENGRTGVYKYDLKTKKLLKKYLLPVDSKAHWFGDLVLNSAGDVFASDSLTPAIYVLNQDKDTLEVFLENESFVNPQGLAFSADEKRIFMADYLKGVFVIDMNTKTPTLLEAAATSTMLGIDGLYFHGGKLIGVQNGVTPNRVVRFSLDNSATRVEKFEVLEANNPFFDEPTLAVLNGGSLFYIANSQWGMIDEKTGKLGPEEKLKDPVVLKLKL